MAAAPCINDVTDPIRYGIGQFIGLDQFFVTRYRKKGYWIAHPIRYPEYRIAAGSIKGLGIGIQYRS
ncbi:hypothetical protein PGT21_015852, partial [Puccinia graminis f. sp. tritici]